MGILRYQPLPRLNVVAKLMYVKTGRDSTGVNWGGDLLKSNSTREQEYGNTIGQGIVNDIVMGSFTASWQLKHNFFIDASIVVRNSECALPIYNNNTTLSFISFTMEYCPAAI